MNSFLKIPSTSGRYTAEDTDNREKYPVQNGTFDVLMKIDVPWTRRRVDL